MKKKDKILAEFKEFKANAFIKTDNLGSTVSDEERNKVHQEELEAYREARRVMNEKIEEIDNEILSHSLEYKFFRRPLLNQMQMIFQDPIDSLNQE